jgi:hypothetical protein
MSDFPPEDDDFFGAYQSPLERDRWDRPLIVPVDGGKKIPYTRISTLSDYVTSSSGLEIWKRRGLAKGLGEREDLAALAAALPPLTGDRDQDRPTNVALDEIIELAIEHSGQHKKARWGTAVHGFTEPGEHGPVPARMVDDVESYKAATAGLEVVATELFVVCDELQCAGTLDHLMVLPAYWTRVLDKKSGHLKPMELAIQLAVYAHSVVYDAETDERSPLPGGEIDLEWALAAHIERGMGRTELYEVDIAAGWEAAKHAAQVRADRKSPKRYVRTAPDYFEAERLALSVAIGQATSEAELRFLYQGHQALWNEKANEMARARLATLESSCSGSSSDAAAPTVSPAGGATPASGSGATTAPTSR